MGVPNTRLADLPDLIEIQKKSFEWFLKEGDRIAKTQDAVVLEKLISQFLYNKATEEPKK